MGCHSTGDLVQESVCCHHGTASICTIHGKAHPTAGATTCSTATRQIKWQTRELMLSFSRFPSRSSLFGGIQRVKISPVGSIHRVEIHIRFRFIEDHDLSRTGVARSVDSAPIRPIIIKDRIKPSLSSVGSVHFLTRARRSPDICSKGYTEPSAPRSAGRRSAASPSAPGGVQVCIQVYRTRRAAARRARSGRRYVAL